jgi:hypothetical protein
MTTAILARVFCWMAGSSLCLMMIQNSRHTKANYAMIIVLCMLSALAGESAHQRLSYKPK